ncbi:MAG: hypothetical protein BWX47_00468 [candidate division Hyd24-12 bacterium ADurb.Bin004]|nr:MAG: hypothetical protein BWX47_00468 [candidate division Hyd24-12 bacterium ADurb.Bin004]
MDEIAVGPLIAPAHPAPELVQVRHAEGVGVVDEDRVDAGQVEARLDDGGGEEYVVLALHEGRHHVLELFRLHLTMCRNNPRVAEETGQLDPHLLQSVYPVVYEEHLSLALQLSLNGGLDDLPVELHQLRVDRIAIPRRRRDYRDVTESRERHVEGSRDRSGGERESVHGCPDLAQIFLLLHSEPVFLVYYHQPQAVEADILLEEPVRSDDYSHRPVRQLLQYLPLFGPVLEAAEAGYSHRELRQPVPEGLVVLIGQYGGRDQHRHLQPGVRHPEGRPESDLRLAVSDVPADQPVHGGVREEVPLHPPYGFHLVGRLLEGEGSLERLHHLAGLAERRTLPGLPFGIDHRQPARDLPCPGPGPGDPGVPHAAPDPVELRRGFPGGHVAVDLPDLGDRDEQLVAVRILDRQAVQGLYPGGDPFQAPEQADAVLPVYYEAAGRQVVEGRHRLAPAEAAHHAGSPAAGEEPPLHQYRDPFLGHPETLGQGCDLYGYVHVVGEQRPEGFGLGRSVAADPYPVAFGPPLDELPHHLLGVSDEALLWHRVVVPVHVPGRNQLHDQGSRAGRQRLQHLVRSEELIPRSEGQIPRKGLDRHRMG